MAGAPPWLPALRELALEQPQAAAFTLALELERDGFPGISGRQAKPWLDRIRGEGVERVP